MPSGKYQKPSALTALEVGSRVWIYVRVSSEQQANRETPIEGQISELRRFAEEHGWVVERVFADEAQGGSCDQREAFQEMIEESKRRPRPVDGILVWNFSRFARDQLDAQFYKADLRRRGYILISYSDDIPAGGFFYGYRSIHRLEESALLGRPQQGCQAGAKNGGRARIRTRWIPTSGIQSRKGTGWH